jgi:hypothetical protein
MKIINPLFVAISFFIVLTFSHQSAKAEDFPLSIKGWQATIIRLEGKNTSKALAVGEVKYQNAKEYCDRDPGGETKQYGGKLTKEQCIQKVLKEDKGKLYSVSADCPRRTLTNDFGTFTLMGQSSDMGIRQNVWRNNITGEILDGSNASGAPVIDEQFKLLCPAFVKP